MGINVFNIALRHMRILQCPFNGHGLSFTVRSRLMTGIGRRSVPCQFRIDARASGKGVFHFLKHEDGGAFGDDKTVSARVEGSARFPGLTVSPGQSACCPVPCNSKSADGRLTASGKCYSNISASHHFEGLAYRIRT